MFLKAYEAAAMSPRYSQRSAPTGGYQWPADASRETLVVTAWLGAWG